MTFELLKLAATLSVVSFVSYEFFSVVLPAIVKVVRRVAR